MKGFAIIAVILADMIVVALACWLAPSALEPKSAQGSGELLAPGTVVASIQLSGSSFGSNWHLCDGHPIDAGRFRDAPVLLSGRFGNPNDLTAKYFRLPNLQGQFLRGFDSTSRLDGDPRYADADLVAESAKAVGTFQGDQIRQHRHSSSDVGDLPLRAGQEHVDHGAVLAAWGGNPYGWNKQINQAWGGSETRPKNCAVNWLIYIPEK